MLPDNSDYILGKTFETSGLSRKFGNITNKIYGNRFNPLDIRKIWARHTLNKALDTKDMRKLNDDAVDAGHNVKQHLLYVV